jgi:hypothetical protein
MRNTHLKLAIVIFCASVAILPQSALRAQAPNSAKDPYILKPIDLPSAETPAPFGFVFGARPALAAGDAPFNYFGDAFYDCWSVGYHSTDYGKTLRIGLRSLGREDAGGWFLEYGSRNTTFDSTINDQDGVDSASKTVNTNYNFVGFGIYYNSGYTGKGVTTGLGLQATAGDVISGSSGFYIGTSVSYGVRIPVGTMALTLEGVLFGTFMDIPSGNPTGSGGIGINAKYGFNFNSN